MDLNGGSSFSFRLRGVLAVNTSSSTTTSSGCTTNCSTLSSGDFYILTGGTTPQVQGESIQSGKLTAIAGSPWNLTAPPYASP